jgi:putative hemolysin
MSRGHDIDVFLARTPAQVEAAQRLRYEVFVREWGAGVGVGDRDADEFDALMDHLVVVDHGAGGRVVGTYRLLRHERLRGEAVFYSSHEFDLAPLLGSGRRLLELGRSCVLREYRSLPVLQKLWHAIAAYVAEHRIELMFGCASLRGTDPQPLREQLAYLHHWHLAPEGLRPRALAHRRTPMELMAKESVDPLRAMRALEPIVRGYLRAGAWVGEDAWVDEDFKAIDVCIVMPTERLRHRHRAHFERAIQRPLSAHVAVEAASAPPVLSIAANARGR